MKEIIIIIAMGILVGIIFSIESLNDIVFSTYLIGDHGVFSPLLRMEIWPFHLFSGILLSVLIVIYFILNKIDLKNKRLSMINVFMGVFLIFSYNSLFLILHILLSIYLVIFIILHIFRKRQLYFFLAGTIIGSYFSLVYFNYHFTDELLYKIIKTGYEIHKQEFQPLYILKEITHISKNIGVYILFAGGFVMFLYSLFTYMRDSEEK